MSYVGSHETHEFVDVSNIECEAVWVAIWIGRRRRWERTVKEVSKRNIESSKQRT